MPVATRLPDTMLCMEITQPGPPDVMQPCRRSVPKVQAGEVLIRVVAAGVNRPDCLQRSGSYPPPPGASDLPGLEVAGIVVAVADDVSKPSVGDRVCALVAGGGYAEYCTAPAVQCLPVPAALTLIEAAAVPETFFTVWSNVFERGRLQPGESLLVHGGASGIGTTAIQLASALGARVYATAGNDAKLALCEKLGALRAINYRSGKLYELVREQTGKRGLDVILDIVGAPYFSDNLRLLADDGRLVIIAVLGGAKTEINLGQLLMKRLTVTGSTLRSRPVAEKGRIARALEEQVWPLLERRQIAPVIQDVLPLHAVAQTHQRLEANEAMGKFVLRVTDEL
jgi:putative PIG3 family NAD(P)H quinone oxidoreductase